MGRLQYMGHRRRIAARVLALGMALSALVSIRPALSAPADIFSIAAPTVGSDPPKATDVKDGDSSVATQTGALQYGYPIQVPPGRNGVAPKLSLAYSSQAPIYGGIAAGWTLSGIAEVREDTSHGRLVTHDPFTDWFGDPMADDRFTSSLVGGRPLVKVPDFAGAGIYAVYRGQNDATWTRFERCNGVCTHTVGTASYTFRWRALSPDGTTFLFGGNSAAACPVVDEGYAPVTEVLDPFGVLRAINVVV